MQDYGSMDLFDLMSYGWQNKCLERDPYIEKQLKSIDDVYQYSYKFYYLNNVDKNVDKIPLTAKKINSIIIKTLTECEDEDFNYHRIITYLGCYINNRLKSIIINNWVNKNIYLSKTLVSWILCNIEKSDKFHILVLKKLIRVYQATKTNSNAKNINFMFKTIGSVNLSEACELLAKSTPVVSAGLLCRKDVTEKYIIKGLKALSKLNTGKDIEVKINFKTLECLGPKARLNTIKHLVNITDKKIPFKECPTKENLKEFLFPCSFKYNEEVSNLIKRFDKNYESKNFFGFNTTKP